MKIEALIKRLQEIADNAPGVVVDTPCGAITQIDLYDKDECECMAPRPWTEVKTVMVF